jgi:Mrp family chromosome partitioning ATPase
VKALAEIPARSPGEGGAGTLRRQDLKALAGLLAELRGPVLVTGFDGDGALAVSIGLASVATAQGIRTALLECDLAAPALAGALGLSTAPGLHEYLLEEAEAPQILQPLVLAGPASATANGPLICVVAGQPAADAAGLLGSEGFRHAAGRLRRAYELVVVHGPPLNGDGTAVEALAAEVETVLACVSRKRATGRSGRALEKTLRRLPAQRAGAVVCG